MPSLTTLRGVLALWVVAYHFWNDVVLLVPAANIFNPIATRGHFAVPGFFILSGYVLSLNYADRFRTLALRPLLRFWFLRLARIYPVHLATLLAVLAMVEASDTLGYRLAEGGYTTRDFLLNLLLMQTWVPDFQLNWNYPAWSISSEWFAYLLFPFAAAVLLKRATSTSAMLAFFAVCLTATIVLYLFGTKWPYFELICVVPTFFAGVAVERLTRRYPATNRVERWLPEGLFLALLSACYAPVEPVAVIALLVLLVALILALGRNGRSAHRIWSCAPAVYLGEVSYSLYMTHTLAQKIVVRLLPASHFADATYFIKAGVLVVDLAMIVGFCLGSYYLIERPVRRWVRRRMARGGYPVRGLK